MVCITPHGPGEVWGLREKQLWGTDSQTYAALTQCTDAPTG